jgi:hypothetical protein
MTYQEPTDFTSKWKAVVIKDVIERDLLSPSAMNYGGLSPSVESTHDPSEVAVLSWRWGTNDNQPSKNVFAVIRYAK